MLKWKSCGYLAIFTAAAVALTAGSKSACAQSARQDFAPVPSSRATLYMGEIVKPPQGWLQFCSDYPGECYSHVPAVIKMSPLVWKKLHEVNERVNSDIKPMTDWQHWHLIESWNLGEDGFGDCEDYVLRKRKELIEAGFPPSALLPATVRDLKKEGHAVLVVRTDKGDFTLDNQTNEILPWFKMPYRLNKILSPENPTFWQDISINDRASVEGKLPPKIFVFVWRPVAAVGRNPASAFGLRPSLK
jgi:predicted transglutaminase-like cysteine proteinase